MVQYGKDCWYKKRLKGLLSLFCSYWIILITFSIVSILAGCGDFMPGNAIKFILSALTLETYYNGAWWYMFAYAVIVIISPIILKAVQKLHPVLILGLGFVLYCVAYYIRFNVDTSNWFLLKFGPLGMTLFEYLIGAICYRYHILSKIYDVWKKPNIVVRYILAILLFAVMLYARTKIVPTLFVAPVSGFVIMALFHFWNKPSIVQRFFCFIGKHSTNIWLTHMFFYLVLFENLVYKAKYPILIFAFMLLITVLVSIILQFMQRPLHRLVAKL